MRTVNQFFLSTGKASFPLVDYTLFPLIYSIARRVNPAYLGPLVRIRRDSDAAEQDIGTVLDELDTSSIASFCSGTTGRIQRVYNQGTLGAAWNSIYHTGTRAIIFQSGALHVVNGKPAMLGQTGNGYRTGILDISNSLMIQSHVFSTVFRTQASTSVQGIAGEIGNGAGDNRKSVLSDTTATRTLIDNINTTFGGSQQHNLILQAVSSQQRQYSHLRYSAAVEPNNSKSYWNGNIQQHRQSTVTWVGNTSFRFHLMDPVFVFTGEFQEFCLSTIPGTTSDDGLLRRIEQEQNTYYNIY